MERRFRIRLDELRSDAEVGTGLLRGVMPRLQAFLQPFLGALPTAEQKTHGMHYVSGLMSELESKDVESIAYLHDCERQGWCPAHPVWVEAQRAMVAVLERASIAGLALEAAGRAPSAEQLVEGPTWK